MAGLEPARVAEILADFPGGGGQRGSGYRVRPGTVLTAAHVVAGPAAVRVRFNADRPDEQVVNGEVVWTSDEIDVAVVAIPDLTALGDEDGQPGYAAVPDADVVLQCVTVGFPRFKLRTDPGDGTRYRDMCHAAGTCAALSNRRSGTLEISVPPPERDPDPDASPWEGMSGAAVWSSGQIIGIVAEHHRSEGLARLAASRLGRWPEALGDERWRSLAALIGVTAIGDVSPPRRDLTYRAQVRDIAPVTLEERSAELAEVAGFCAGEESYLWWQGPPWAGKTALASWVVLNPPPGVVVVSFFVTARLAGQADSGAFTAALVSQLAPLAGVQPAASASPADRDAERRWLLDQATARVAAGGRRLLLVVDGLDEDQGRQPSIASLLPPRPPPGLRVLVTSRPFPGLPDDVPGGHPLRRCQPRLLSAYSGAQGIEAEARQDLGRLGGQNAEVVGVLAAAGGGLTCTELAALTGQPEFDLRGRLGTSAARVLTTRAAADRDQVILFAHETLRGTAEAMFGSDLARYRDRIHGWADEHAARGWPASTPRYLLQPYGRLLAGLGDAGRLTRVAADPARQELMLQATYSDTASLAELDTALGLVTGTTSQDLMTLAKVAISRDRVVRRGEAMPVILPGAWARLGNAGRAEALARGLHDESDRAWALADVACQLAADAPAEARRLADLAEALLREDQAPPERSPSTQRFQLYTAIVRSTFREPLAQVAEALARTGQPDRAGALVTRITDPWGRSLAWSAVVAAGDASAAGHAIEAAMKSEVPERVHALTELAKALRRTDPAGAGEVAKQALAEATRSPCPAMTFSGLDTRARGTKGRRLHDLWDVLQDAAARVPAGEDDELTGLLAEASARCGTFLDANLTSYALGPGRARALVLRCLKGYVVNSAYEDGNMQQMIHPQEMVMLATVALAVAGSFLQHGLMPAARELLGSPPGKEWAEVMTDWGPPDAAELAATASVDRVRLLARLAVRLAPDDPAAATRVAAKAESLARDARLPDAAIEMVSATYSLLGHGKRAAATMNMPGKVTSRLTAWNGAVLRRTDPASGTPIQEPEPAAFIYRNDRVTWHVWAILGDAARATEALQLLHSASREAYARDLGVLARIMADAGRLGEAERVAGAAEGMDACFAWAAMARARARNGQSAEAMVFLRRALGEASRLRYAEHRGTAVAMVAAACAEIDLQWAVRTARFDFASGEALSAPGPERTQKERMQEKRIQEDRVQKLCALAVGVCGVVPAMAAALLDEAEAIAERIPDDHLAYGRDRALSRYGAMNAVAVAAACAGAWDQAGRLCLAVPEWVQSPVPAIMAGVPDPAAYLPIRGGGWLSVHDPWLPPEFSLIGAATGMRSGRPTDIPRARQLIGRLLRAGNWTWALGALVGTDPGIALELCDTAYAQLTAPLSA